MGSVTQFIRRLLWSKTRHREDHANMQGRLERVEARVDRLDDHVTALASAVLPSRMRGTRDDSK